MIPEPESASERFLFDWATVFALGGGLCLLFGVVVGWIIWRKARTMAEVVESGNREAFAEYENTSDEVSRIRAELGGRR